MVIFPSDASPFAFSFFIVFLARSQAAGTYFPIVTGVNALYILLCLGVQGYESYLNFWSIAGVLSLLMLTYVAYNGILDNAANRNPRDKSLVGGSFLDLLGLTMLIQFSTVLWSPRFYWLLIVVPIGGGWSLYSTFKGGGDGSAAKKADQVEPPKDDEALAARRQKRAERRRQKRA